MSNYLQNIDQIKQSRGGRISSSSHRKSYEQVEDFTGLEDNVNRYDLLLLVKRIGKQAGFTPRMISLLDYYMAFTRDCDWEQGSSPIIYQSLSKTALDLGVSERQVQRLEQSLFEAGALTWHDSGNHRRYGKRDESGRIMYAYGVDLTPLAYLKASLEERLQEKRLIDAAWMETKRQISYYRGQIRAIMCEMELLTLDGQGDYADILTDLEKKYEPLSLQIRTHLGLERVRDLLASHKELYALAVGILEPQAVDNLGDNIKETKEMSPKNDTDDVHYNSTIKKQSNKLDTNSMASPSFLQEGVAENPQRQLDIGSKGEGSKRKEPEQESSQEHSTILSTGLQHVTLKQLLNISSERLKAELPMEPRPMNANDFIEAAYRLNRTLGISQSSWGHACMTLSRVGAAVCVILTDQANLREENRVMKPGAYFNAMVNRAKSGELKLHKSVMGKLRRDNDNEQTESDQTRGRA
tara:strand:+ start:34102 stop:35505 length:1404 start_codon:yes stop_codon:yes gene_type:complete